MKKILQLALALVITLTITVEASAQLVNGSYVPNFTLNDIEGNTHDLYTYLDQGYPVLLDVFAVWCGPCLSYAPTLEDAYHDYGPDGDDSMIFLALEGDDNTNDQLVNNVQPSIANWQEVMGYPIINQTGSFNDDYNVAYFPTIYLVSPNRITDEIGQVPATTIGIEAAEAAENIATETDDASILNYVGDQIFCGNLVPGVRIQNMGTEPMTSMDITLQMDGVDILTNNWTGNLDTYDVVEYSFGDFSSTGDVDIAIFISNPNGNPDGNNANDAVWMSVSEAAQTGEEVRFSITTDEWPSEIDWSVVDENGTVLYSNAEFGNLAVNTTYEQTWILPSEGCHEFIVTDGYGDGLVNGPTGGSVGFSNGAISITYDGLDGEVVLFNNIDYGDGTEVGFKVDLSANQPPIAAFEYTIDEENLTVTIDANTSTNGETYFWNFGDGVGFSADIVPAPYTYAVGGAYEVCLTASSANGFNTTCEDISLPFVDGIDDLTFTQSVSLFPVPAANELNIAFELSSQEDMSIEITNVAGQLMKVINSSTFVSGTHNMTVNTTDYAEGMYFVSFVTNEATVTQRFTVAK